MGCLCYKPLDKRYDMLPITYRKSLIENSIPLSSTNYFI
jgi:hypothetical protein